MSLLLELTTQGKRFAVIADEAHSSQTGEKQKAYLIEIIEKVNDLFKGELTDNDKLVYVNNVIRGKLLESKVLIQQALNNSKEQFANSPDLDNSLMIAIMEALDAHNLMSSHAPVDLLERTIRTSSFSSMSYGFTNGTANCLQTSGSLMLFFDSGDDTS